MNCPPQTANLEIRRFVFSFLKDYIPQQVKCVEQTIHIECMQAVPESRIEWLNSELERVAEYSNFHWLKGSTFMLKLLRDVRIVIQGLFAYSQDIFNDSLDYLEVSQYLRNAAQDLAHACGDDQKTPTPRWMKTRNKTDINDYVKSGRKFNGRNEPSSINKGDGADLGSEFSRSPIKRPAQNTLPAKNQRLMAPKSVQERHSDGAISAHEARSQDDISELSSGSQAYRQESGGNEVQFRTKPSMSSEDRKNQEIEIHFKEPVEEENCVWGLMILALDDFTGSKAVEVIPTTIAEILENALEKPNSFAFHLGQAGRHSPPMPSDYITMFGIVTPLLLPEDGDMDACKDEFPVLARQTLERAYGSGIMDFSCSVGLSILESEDPSADSIGWYHRAVNSLIIARSMGLNQIGPLHYAGSTGWVISPDRRPSLCLSLGSRTDIAISCVANAGSPRRIGSDQRSLYQAQVEKQKKMANKPIRTIRFGDLLNKSRDSVEQPVKVSNIREADYVIQSPFVDRSVTNGIGAEETSITYPDDPNPNPRKNSQMSEIADEVSFKSAEVIRQLQTRDFNLTDSDMLIDRLKPPRDLNYRTPVHADTLLLVAMGLRRSVNGTLATDGKINNQVVKFLLSSEETKVNLTNNEGISALMIASMMGMSSLAQQLLDLDADPNLTTTNGKTALILAVQHCCFELSSLSLEESKEIVRVLLASNTIELDKPDRVGRTALVHAAKIGNNTACRMLVDKKCDVNALPTHDFGKTPLMWASCTSNQDLLRLLLQAKADPNMKTKNGSTPLHLAASQPDPDICIMLTDAGGDLYAVNNAGMTTLMIAVYYLRRDVVHMILCKLDAEEPKREGYDEFRNEALAIAKRKGTKGIIELFSKDG